MFPVTADGLRDFNSRNGDALSDAQAGKAGQHKVVIALNPINGNASDFALSWCAGIGDVGLHYDVLGVGAFAK